MKHDLSGWTIVIDLDGTLVETAPDLHAALNHVLAKEGLAPVELETIRMMVGDGAKALIRKGLSHNHQTVDESYLDTDLWPAFLTFYETNITRHSRVFDGALEVLNRLASRGAKLSICTNKTHHLAEQVLGELGIRQLFDSVLGADLASLKKPNAAHILETIAQTEGSAEKAIMIGDSQTDERAASNAELPFIMVSFGYGHLSGAPLRHLEEVDHWSEIEPAINRIAF